MAKPRRVMIAGGGTGGHVFPGVAVAESLKRRCRDCEVRFVGTDRGLEAKVVPKSGFELWTLPVRGLPRRPGVAQLSALFQFVRSLVITGRWFARWKPDVVLGTGGYASAPPIIIGTLFRVPIVLQEQNAVPGAVNRFLSRFATEVHLNFAGARRFFRRRDHLRLSGNPLRSGLLSGSRNRAYERFKLSSHRLTIVVLGGSAGASSINRAIADAASTLATGESVQFLIQSGQRDLQPMREKLESSPFPCVVHAFINEIDDVYTIADVIVCRAGAMTVSEVAACGVPAIFVPYPYATDNHQRLNAEEMVDRGAAVMVLDAELDGDRLASELQVLIRDPARRRRMASSARGSARFDAADVIASAMVALMPQPEPVETPEEKSGRPQSQRRSGGRERPRGRSKPKPKAAPSSEPRSEREGERAAAREGARPARRRRRGRRRPRSGERK